MIVGGGEGVLEGGLGVLDLGGGVPRVLLAGEGFLEEEGMVVFNEEFDVLGDNSICV